MRVLISGYYGFGNAGDEAILAGMLRSLHAAGGVEATVLSRDPAATREMHGVAAIDRNAFGLIWRRLREQTDLFISGGGGLIQDRTSRRSALYYLGLVKMAQQARVPVYLYGQGVGPVASLPVRVAARAILKGVIGAGARDSASRRLLTQLGVHESKALVTADPAFALDPLGPAEKAEQLDRHGIPLGRRPLVGVVWRRPAVNGERERDASTVLHAVAHAVGALAESIDGRVVVIGLHADEDDAPGEALARKLGEGRTAVYRPTGLRDYREQRAVVEAMDFNLCVRYHGLLFSALGGVPAVSLAYDPKVRQLAKQLQLPSFPVSMDASTLQGAMTSVWEDASGVSRRLRRTVRAFRARAFGEGARCLSLAGAPTRRRNGDDHA